MQIKTTTASRREASLESTRYLHVSCVARMVNDPAGIHLPMIPWIASPGATYDIGSNAAKRRRRLAQKIARGMRLRT